MDRPGAVERKRYVPPSEALTKILQPGATTPVALDGITNLSDFENVWIIDAAGNGDFDTLGAAMASPDVQDGDLLIGYGTTTETGPITAKDVFIQGGGNFVVDLEDFQLTLPSTMTRGVVWRDFEIRDTGLAADIEIDANPIVFDCMTFTLDAGDINIMSGITLVRGGTVIGAGGDINVSGGTLDIADAFLQITGTAINMTDAASAARIKNCDIIGTTNGIVVTNAASISLTHSIVQGNTTFVIQPATTIVAHNLFQGAVTANAAWASAPFYLNVFDGTVINITADVGVANGTNVEI